LVTDDQEFANRVSKYVEVVSSELASKYLEG